MTEYISRDAAIKAVCEGCNAEYGEEPCEPSDCNIMQILRSIPAADVRPVPAGGIGEMSDGYHTFNGLYYQRMVLFAALVKAYKDKAWKSWKHEDGKPCFDGGWFIVGIDTPQGSYTYHYEAKDFNLFDCEELPVAKHWDGHTEEDVTRLLSLDVRPVPHGRLIDADALMHEFEKAQRTMEQHGQEYSCSFMSSSQELSTEWYCVEDMVENAPTILEAEEGE